MNTLYTVLTFGPLRVLVNDETGEPETVQDALTGLDARLMYSRGDIARAQARARLAAASFADLG